MLDWSIIKYKFTFGLGGLAGTAIMSELWKTALPFWAVLIVAMLPFSAFVIASPADFPGRFVRAAHLFASLWYLASTVGLWVALCMAPRLPRGWPMFVLFGIPGLFPSVLVIGRSLRGRYGSGRAGPV